MVAETHHRTAFHRVTPVIRLAGLGLFLCLVFPASLARAKDVPKVTWTKLDHDYHQTARVLLKDFCLGCHATIISEGDLDLERFQTIADIRTDTTSWIKVSEMLANGQMPPADAPQPTPAQRKQLQSWIARYLHAEALAHAGDPGPVVLRRLNNAQYTYTIRDLTGLEHLEPARTFPADNAAGEGFTNAGAAMVMSPALLSKYFDAAKKIAAHAVLTREGFRFSEKTTRRDWTNEILAEIREIYHRYAVEGKGTHIRIGGAEFQTNVGGRIPLKRYLAATIEARESLNNGTTTIEAVAKQRDLNAKYLRGLWGVLNDREASLMLARIGRRWRNATADDVPALVKEINRWQALLTDFQKVGHMQEWTVPAHPLKTEQEIHYKIAASNSQETVTLYLQTRSPDDRGAVIWQRPRFAVPGREPVLLRDVRALAASSLERRDRRFAASKKSLFAAAKARAAGDDFDVAALANEHGLKTDVLSAWLTYLGVGAEPATTLNCFKNPIQRVGKHDFIQGWGSLKTPQIIANSSNKLVRVPGTMPPGAVAVHPDPSRAVAVGWRSPIQGPITVTATITDAHPACGNGVNWSLELQRGAARRRLASGTANGVTPVVVEPVDDLVIQEGDLLSLVIGPRDKNHVCDLTEIKLAITGPNAQWDLQRGVSPDILAENPHPDQHGHENVWYFYTEPAGASQAAATTPGGSILARWHDTTDAKEQRTLAAALEQLLVNGPSGNTSKADIELYQQLSALNGPLVSFKAAERRPRSREDDDGNANPQWGLDPDRFGKAGSDSPIDPASLMTTAPSVLKVRVPADLVRGGTFVATAKIASKEPHSGSAQAIVSTAPPEGELPLKLDAPILVRPESEAEKRLHKAFADFRHWFPAALCYMQIVPTDEGITLTLYHREDEPLCELMLSESEHARLDHLWEELRFVSRDAFMMVDAYSQLLKYASQGGNKSAYEQFREPVEARAEALRQSLREARPKQLTALIRFADQIYRRPLAEAEQQGIRALYRELTGGGLSHEDAFRLTLARLFIAPAFLYRLEDVPPGNGSAPVTDWELATRLSYFLTGSMPDAELRRLAATGRLRDPDVLAAQARRLLQASTARRLAVQFGCQWLQIYNFDSFDNKSSKTFPGFNALRDDMYEEAIRLMTDLFRRDGSMLELINGDYVIVNEVLAEHYDIPGVTGPGWEKVADARKYGRGGVLGLAALLSKQAGASRTSPILRGAWISDVLLGEKLPNPPAGVPPLPEGGNTDDLTMRQITRLHTTLPLCVSCHQRIDPLGFSLAKFDAIGRWRTHDAGGRKVNAKSKLQDGTKLNGIAGLRHYIGDTRREAFVEEFCRMLLGYALGRKTQLSDEPLLDKMGHQLKQNEYRISVAVEMIVRSRQFREIRAANWKHSSPRQAPKPRRTRRRAKTRTTPLNPTT